MLWFMEKWRQWSRNQQLIKLTDNNYDFHTNKCQHFSLWLHRKIVILGPTSYLCQSSAILSEQVVMVAVSGCIIWQFTALSFQILLLLKSLCKKPWGSTKEILSIYYFPLPADEGGAKIFISFSIFQFNFGNFDWGREVYLFMDLMRGTRELTQI